MLYVHGGMVARMTLLALKSAAKKVWAWIKRNWKFLVGLTLPILLWLLARRSFDQGKILERVRADYEKEINIINESHELEKNKNELALKRYEDVVAEIERRYEEEEKKLSSAKKKEIKKIIEENGADPDFITRRIAELTGYEIHSLE